MTLIQEQKYLSPVEFRFVIKRLPKTAFHVQAATLPGLSVNPVQHNTPFKAVYVTADKAEFEQLSVEFIVDQNMENYNEIYNWIVGSAFPDNYEQHSNLIAGEGLYSDATLTLMTAQGNPNKSIELVNVFPISLSSIQFDTKSTDVQYATCTATFQLDSFKVL